MENINNRIVLAAASFYKKSYYFNNDFSSLPTEVQQELRIFLTKTAEYIQGNICLGFYEEGQVFLEASGHEDDFDYDEIAAKYEVNRLIKDKKEFLNSLQLYYVYTVCNYEDF